MAEAETRPAVTLVRRAMPTVDQEDMLRQPSPEETEVDTNASIKDLLLQAQELYSVRDPASARITRIKETLITRLSPVYDEHEQLTLFENLNGIAFRDPEDNQQIVIQHPDIPIQFRLKKSPVTQWKTIMRSVGQEIERRREELLRLELLSAVQRTSEDARQIMEHNSYIEALEWVLHQTEVRHGYRLSGRFVAAENKQGTEE